MPDPRVVFAAPKSGSGKTTVTCGVLQALHDRGMNVVSMKCGPDYIDPMYEERVIGVPAANLDLFFTPEETLRRLFLKHAKGAEISVIEGVMGYYDGLGAATDEASTYRVAEALRAPVVLILDARGQSLSALAELQGFFRFREDSRIRGVIFNRMSTHIYKALASEVVKMGVRPLGFLPKIPDLTIESRHLGLQLPEEIQDLSEKLHALAETLSETVDLDALVALAHEAEPLTAPPEPEVQERPKVKIAAAKDEAFCFYYKDNLELLERMGAEITYFSPVHDRHIPESAQGLILPGGYPELYAEALSENTEMRESVARAIRNGLPCLAECGGFMYLHREMEDMDGRSWPMCGVIDAKAWKTDRLGRFGYVTLTANGENGWLPEGEEIRAHEFHYFESGDCGSAMHAEKPAGSRSWDCIHAEGNLFAGFPHLYYESDPQFIARFLRRCAGEE